MTDRKSIETSELSGSANATDLKDREVVSHDRIASRSSSLKAANIAVSK